MDLAILSLEQVNIAVEQRKPLIQLFNPDRTLAAFVHRSDFLKTESSADKKLSWQILHFGFDYHAYETWVNTKRQNHTDHDVCAAAFVEAAHPGVRIFESNENFIPDFYAPTESSPFSFNEKFRPEFFPEGTVFTASRVVARMCSEKLGPDVLVVRRVIQNDVNSYVIETTIPEILPFGYEPEFFKINIGHVERILVRGNGKMNVEYFTGPDIIEGGVFWVKNEFPKLANKNEWLLLAGNNKPSFKMKGFTIQPGACVNIGYLVFKLCEQTFSEQIESQLIRINRMKKKKAKRYIHQNINRFLVSASKLQRSYEDTRSTY